MLPLPPPHSSHRNSTAFAQANAADHEVLRARRRCNRRWCQRRGCRLPTESSAACAGGAQCGSSECSCGTCCWCTREQGRQEEGAVLGWLGSWFWLGRWLGRPVGWLGWWLGRPRRLGRWLVVDTKADAVCPRSSRDQVLTVPYSCCVLR